MKNLQQEKMQLDGYARATRAILDRSGSIAQMVRATVS